MKQLNCQSNQLVLFLSMLHDVSNSPLPELAKNFFFTSQLVSINLSVRVRSSMIMFSFGMNICQVFSEDSWFICIDSFVICFVDNNMYWLHFWLIINISKLKPLCWLMFSLYDWNIWHWSFCQYILSQVDTFQFDYKLVKEERWYLEHVNIDIFCKCTIRSFMVFTSFQWASGSTLLVNWYKCTNFQFQCPIWFSLSIHWSLQ